MGWRDFQTAPPVHNVHNDHKETFKASLSGQSVLSEQVQSFEEEENYPALDRAKSIEEATRLFKKRGWIQIFSGHLQENFYLIRHERIKTPSLDYPRYTLKEIQAVAGLSIEELQTMHEAKQIFSGAISHGEGKKNGSN